MRTLTQADFLALWERGRSLHPIDQGLLTIQAAFPEVQYNIADWPIGRRNGALAQLRLAVFGAPIRGWTKCRQCSEQLEFEIDGRAIAESPAVSMQERVVVNGQVFRLPTSRDLAAVAKESDTAIAANLLLQRCCDAEIHAWTDAEIDTIGEHMSAADPLAEIALDFHCPACSAVFQELLDLPSFLWSEMEARAKRLLIDVHTLASAYGWSEAEILALSSARRELYLEMVRG